jgi:hypothetical protein
MRRALALLLAVSVIAGCGSEKEKAPDPKAIPTGGGTVLVRYPGAGVRFRAPQGWRRQAGKAPLVAAVQTGQATIAVWRYPRTEQLPVTHNSLQAAKAALVAQIGKRDASFKLQRAKLLHVGPKRAIQVLGLGQINGSRRMIRSTHIYTERAEYVIDAYAPPTVFDRVDRGVFATVLKSLEISKPPA